ncbi:MAG: hypothetical protein CR972_04480 [Candidatus Moraniibacteriota bacterium]|nr:MAG: hypothetical protein CR972_04480 [Candidatus Moranbacteria bacterium]
MKRTEIKLPIMGDENLKKLVTANEKNGVKYFVATVRAKAIVKQGSELLEWCDELNPRHANRSSSVWKEIMQSVDFYPEEFIYKNNGLVIMADSVSYDNKNKSINIILKDKSIHGVANGGHTLSVLHDYIENNENDEDVFVKIELLAGFDDPGKVVEIVTARNTSKQVSEESVMEARGEFAEIKKSLDGELCEDRISYSEFEIDEEGRKKDISIKEIIALLIAFDNSSFDIDNPPIIAYSGKKATLKHYHTNRNTIDKLYTKLLPKLLKLWDVIYEEFPNIYDGNILKAKKGGTDKFIVKDLSKKNKKFPLKFIEKESDYKIPPAWIFPLFSSFKTLLKEKNGVAFFPDDRDPVEFFLKHKKEFTGDLMSALEASQNDPQTFAKNKNNWKIFIYKIRLLLDKE